MSVKTQGARVAAYGADDPVGSYWKNNDGTWYGKAPNGLIANLAGHTVIEHDDGTISVLPSILVSRGALQSWHGYLERGVWREC